MISSVTTHAIEMRTLAEQETAVEYATLTVAEIGPWLQRAFEEVAAYLERKGAGPAGAPFARYRRTADGRVEIEAGFPASTPTSGEGEVEPSDLPGGPAAATIHVGPYDAIEAASLALCAWIREQGGEPLGDAWEVYLVDPSLDHDLTTWRTDVVQPYHP
jgi:effector-binding domain-containing protein